jgi:hypothetical protein
MKVKGALKSNNIEDRRAYFGSDSLDPDYWREDRQMDFLKASLSNPKADSPQTFKKLSIEDIITEAVNGR